MYWPSWLVAVVRTALVAVSRSSTFASGTMAPDGSVTCPSTCPVVNVCPVAGYACQYTHDKTRAPQRKNLPITARLLEVLIASPWPSLVARHPAMPVCEIERRRILSPLAMVFARAIPSLGSREIGSKASAGGLKLSRKKNPRDRRVAAN